MGSDEVLSSLSVSSTIFVQLEDSLLQNGTEIIQTVFEDNIRRGIPKKISEAAAYVNVQQSHTSVAVRDDVEFKIDDFFFRESTDLDWSRVGSLVLQKGAQDFFDAASERLKGPSERPGKLKIAIVSSAPTFLAKILLEKLNFHEYGHVFGCEYEKDDMHVYWRSLKDSITRNLSRITIASSDSSHAHFALNSQLVEMFIDLDPNRDTRGLMKRNQSKCFTSRRSSDGSFDWTELTRVPYGH